MINMHTLPINQRNANLSEQLEMRVGIPHKGGKLAQNAFENDYKVMVSANAFWNLSKLEFQWPEASDLYELDFALDSGGFTALKLFQSKGKQRGMAGIFPWTYEEYIEFASLIAPAWWSQPDLCCEKELANNQEEIDYRVNATATLLEGVLRVLYAWQNKLAKEGWNSTMIANQLKPPIPVLQGRSVSDYIKSLDLLQEVWGRWEPWLAPPALIGLGSVCRRDLHHPTEGLYAILAGLEGRLPSNCRLHLFGVKGAALSEIKMLNWISSADSMAFDYGARIKAHQSGFSNTLLHRSTEMNRWMAAANLRIKPTAGDQYRLQF